MSFIFKGGCMAKSTVNKIADYLLWFACSHGDPLTNLKLQKLIYYAQAWHLALKDSPLFEDRFEAWVHGPVVPSLYRRFKENGWSPIIVNNEPEGLSTEIITHLQDVLKVYLGFSAYDLERLSHSELPWKSARGDLPPDEASNAKISSDEMKAYYRSLQPHGE